MAPTDSASFDPNTPFQSHVYEKGELPSTGFVADWSCLRRIESLVRLGSAWLSWSNSPWLSCTLRSAVASIIRPYQHETRLHEHRVSSDTYFMWQRRLIG